MSDDIKKASITEIRAMKDNGELFHDPYVAPGISPGRYFWADAEIIDMQNRLNQVQMDHIKDGLKRQVATDKQYPSPWDHLHSVYEEKKPDYNPEYKTVALRDVAVRRPTTVHSWEDAMKVCELPHIDEAIRSLVDSPSQDNAVCLVRFILDIGAKK